MALLLLLSLIGSTDSGARTQTGSQEKCVMRLVFPETGELRYQGKNEMSMEMMDQSMDQTVSLVQVFAVAEKSEDWTTLKMTMQDFKFESSYTEGTDDARNDMSELAMDMTVNGRGEIGTLTVDGKESPGASMMLGNSMGGAKSMGFMGFIYPKEAIGVGSKWVHKVDASKLFEESPMMSNSAGEIAVDFEVIERKNEKGVALLVFTATLVGSISTSMDLGGGGSEMTMTMSGFTTHTVEEKTGLVVFSVGEATVSTTSDAFDMNQKMKISLERLTQSAA